jgi:hypothetical protein
MYSDLAEANTSFDHLGHLLQRRDLEFVGRFRKVSHLCDINRRFTEIVLCDGISKVRFLVDRMTHWHQGLRTHLSQSRRQVQC